MRTKPPLSCLCLLLLLGGCSDVGSEFSRWSEGDPSDPDGDGGPDDDDAAPGGPGAGPGGFFQIGYWDEVPKAGESVGGGGAGFNAGFSDEVTRGIPATGGVEFNSPAGPDSCAVTVWDAADTETEGGSPGESLPLHAGVVTLTSPSWSIDIEVDWQNGEFHYNAEFDPQWQIHFETYYEVSATGGTFPAFHSTEDLLVPDPIHLLSPDPDTGFEVSDEDFLIEWVGGSAEELHLEFFYPEGFAKTDARPCIVFFFGGGWTGGDTSQFYAQAKYLASRGMVAICAQYRADAEPSPSTKQKILTTKN